MDRGNTFSLTIMVIVMALLAVFVGYLLGNWLIQLVTGDVSYQQAYEKQIEKEETVEDENSSTSLPSTTSNLDNQSSTQEPNPIPDKPDNNSSVSQSQLSGDVYVIQIGAFSKLNNARNLKQKLGARGLNVVINSEGSLHKVQMAVTGEEEAEKKKSTLKNLGYNVFVTH